MLPKDEQNSGLIHEPNYVAAKNSLQIKAKAWENTAASKATKAAGWTSFWGACQAHN